MSSLRPAACFSPEICGIPNLEIFLGRKLSFRPTERRSKAGAVLLWGREAGGSAEMAAGYARKNHLPLLHLEDGFLRSLAPGGTPLSLIVDEAGLYYDAAVPSDLENILNSRGWETPELLDKAELALKALLAGDLSRYNYAPPAPAGLLGDGSRPRIVIVDQPQGDPMVTLGRAGPADFQNMLETALTKHPGADFFIKVHPEVIAGLKPGYFRPHDKSPRFISENYSPLSLLAQADAVYTVSSQMGFEALMLNKPVYCFGLPFYAGWGLTKDRKQCPRRNKRRSLLEVFAAAYLLYPRYINPVNGELTDISEVIRLLNIQRGHALSNRGAWAVLGFSAWKHSQVRAYLQTPGAEVRFFRELRPASDWAAQNGGRILAWSSKVADMPAPHEGLPLVRMEDGFFRSVGLGSDFQAPYSLVMDPDGIYYDPQTPSRLETLLGEYDFQAEPDLLARARHLRSQIKTFALTKYNEIGLEDWSFSPPPGRRVLLVPGQVEDDASIQLGSPAIKTNLGLLREVRRANEDALIIYKPHPDVESGNRQGKVPPREARRYADIVLRNISLAALWRHVHEVHTLTSQVGFEALLRELPTHTYGLPFYAGWGLTADRLECGRRKRSLRLDELVAGALILYPRYYDWGSGMFCGPEDVLTLLAKGRGQGRGRTTISALLRRACRRIYFKLQARQRKM